MSAASDPKTHNSVANSLNQFFKKTSLIKMYIYDKNIYPTAMQNMQEASKIYHAYTPQK